MKNTRKKNIKVALVLIGGWLLSLSGTSFSSSEEKILLDFEQGIDSAYIEAKHLNYTLSATEGNHTLIVNSQAELADQGLIIHETKDAAWGVDGYYLFEADVKNLSDHPIQVEMFVGNDPDGLIRWYCSDYLDLEPNQAGTITVELAWTPWVFDVQPEIVGMRGAPGMKKTDLQKVKSVTFKARYATQACRFSIDNIRVRQELEERSQKDFFPFIDAFGQYKHATWSGKVETEKQLKKAHQQEEKELKKYASAPHLNQYGGWEKGPSLKATGYFRTEKVDGKWWMVDPEGKLFWSNGLNCVNSKMTITGVQDRTHYFENLPIQDSPFKDFYTQGTWSSHGYYKDKVPFIAYSFLESNLYRIYGKDWAEKFRDLTHRRMRSWGMNTFGNVSDMEAAQQQRTPYVGTVWIRNTPKIEGSDGFWGKFHDVFSSAFRQVVRASMEAQKQGAEDPWCIGFFVDNELSWGLTGSLSLGTLKSSASQPAKIEFINDLKAKYQQIEKLDQAWGTNYKSWENMLSSTAVPTYQKAKQDLDAFYAKIADTYFRIIREELDRIAPNHLYLGCRFAWANNQPTIAAAAKYSDVLSFNKYEYSVERLSLPEGIDKPIMIGEYHFGATDQGHFHPGVKKAKDQNHRGELYTNYIQGALRNTHIVGAHWFQYTDQAPTGREDGENYNVGFISITNQPYHDFLKHVRETNYKLYDYRYQYQKAHEVAH